MPFPPKGKKIASHLFSPEECSHEKDRLYDINSQTQICSSGYHTKADYLSGIISYRFLRPDHLSSITPLEGVAREIQQFQLNEFSRQLTKKPCKKANKNKAVKHKGNLCPHRGITVGNFNMCFLCSDCQASLLNITCNQKLIAFVHNLVFVIIQWVRKRNFEQHSNLSYFTREFSPLS